MTLDRDTSAAFLQSVDRFIAARLAPCAARIDEEARFPQALYRELGQLGVFALTRSGLKLAPFEEILH